MRVRTVMSIGLIVAAFGFGCGDDDTNDATNNGATNNGATNNGATNNGATNNGATNNAEAAIAASTAAHQPYTDISAALADGYVSTQHFVMNEDASAGMGIHFVDFANTSLDPDKANVLMYGVTDAGEYELLGVEWLVPSEGLDAAPELFGETFAGPMPGHGPEEPEHYELHAWFFADNPDGTFAAFNPDVAAPAWWGDFEELLEALEPFEDVAAAEAAGYVSTEECVANPGGEGAMGVHYLNTTITELSVTEPNVLLYGDDGDGGTMLLGAEWFIPSEGLTEAPQLLGQTFEGPMPGHGPDQPEHYELHVWTHATNPAGIFAEFNQTLSCPSE